MDLSEIKMVVSDMDGTLLNSRHEVSDRFFSLFRALQERDVLFVAASGRQYGSMVAKLDAIKDDIIIIAENGAFVKQRDEVLMTTPMEPTDVDTVLQITKGTKGAHAAICTQDRAYVDGSSQDFMNLLEEYYSNFDVVRHLEGFAGEVLKIAIYHFESSERYIYPAVRHLDGGLKIKVSGPNWVDVSHTHAHKGFALDKVMEANHITADQVMVFGDYNNDLEMMELSNYSFAMANAHSNILKAAKYKTSSNDDQGVERILEKLLTAKVG